MDPKNVYWDGPYLFKIKIPEQINKWVLILIALFLYWIIPLIGTIIEKTYISKESIQFVIKLLNFKLNENSPFFNQLLITKGTSYFNDMSHHLFTFFLVLGLSFGIIIIKKINISLDKLFKNNIFCGYENEVVIKIEKYVSYSKHYVWFIPSILFSMFSFILFVYLCLSNSTLNWWGNIYYGYSGIIFSFVILIMVLFGTFCMEYIAIISYMLGKIMETSISLRPFHEDGCNGLESLGILIVYLWGFAISLASTVFITLHYGYLGIEKNFFIWLLASFAIVCIPMIALYPLIKSIKSVYNYRRNKLANIEKKISKVLIEIESYLDRDSDFKFKEKTELFERLTNLYKQLNSINMWPFDVRALIGAILIYFIQAVLVLKQLITNIMNL